MKTSRESATYLYCLVQAARRPSVTGAPRGLPGTSGLRLLQAAPDLWLVAADAPLQQYGGAPIERGLRDLDWVALRGAAHARVVEHFARRRTTLPMKLFTLFTEDARALADVGAGRAAHPARARSRRGRQEWGVRVRLDAQLARRTLRRRPAGNADGAQAGTRFLMRKKHERDAAQALVHEGRAAVASAFETLAGLAEASRRRPRRRAGGHAPAARRRAARRRRARRKLQAHHPTAGERSARARLSAGADGAVAAVYLRDGRPMTAPTRANARDVLDTTDSSLLDPRRQPVEPRRGDLGRRDAGAGRCGSRLSPAQRAAVRGRPRDG
jgi:hypothetical protein